MILIYDTISKCGFIAVEENNKVTEVKKASVSVITALLISENNEYRLRSLKEQYNRLEELYSKYNEAGP